MNQILQVPALKAELTALLPTKGFVPQMLFRVGYATADREHSPRRALEHVIAWRP
jgi:hypothetical protein